MGTLQDALTIVFCVAVSSAAVVAAVAVWRDDHSKRLDGDWVQPVDRRASRRPA